MNEAEKLSYLAEMRRREASFAQQAKQAFPVPAGTPQLGSFQEDDPEVHMSFYTPAPEEQTQDEE